MKSEITKRNSGLDKEFKRFDGILETISNLHSQINSLVEKIADLYVYGVDNDTIQTKLDQLVLDVKKVSDDCTTLTEQTQESYCNQQGFVPTDINLELKSLELAAENMKGVMADKEREFKRAKTVRTEYLICVDHVQVWLQQAELRIQDRTLDPVRLKDLINDVQKELAAIHDKMDTLKQCALIIVDNSQSDDEKRLIQTTIEQLERQIEQLQTDLEDKKHHLHDSMDALSRFMKLYEIVMKWTTEKREFIAISLNVTTLAEARQKMNEYMVRTRVWQHFL